MFESTGPLPSARGCEVAINAIAHGQSPNLKNRVTDSGIFSLSSLSSAKGWDENIRHDHVKQTIPHEICLQYIKSFVLYLQIIKLVEINKINEVFLKNDNYSANYFD